MGGAGLRTPLADRLVVLRRPAALAAAVAALGGAAAAAAPWLGAWRLVAQVEVSGTQQEQVVATLPCATTTPLVWAAVVLGAVAVAVAVSVAVDLPVPAAARLAGLAALLLAALAAALVLGGPPGLGAFADEPGVAQLRAGLDALPTGVTIDLAVRPGAGPVVLLVGAVLVVAGTGTALRRG